MNRDTFEQFKNTLQGQLDSLIGPKTRTDGGFASLASDPPPITPTQAVSGFVELLGSFTNKANAWDLDRAAADRLVDDATAIYTKSYDTWVKLPLSGDAPAAVVGWQKQAWGK